MREDVRVRCEDLSDWQHIAYVAFIPYLSVTIVLCLTAAAYFTRRNRKINRQKVTIARIVAGVLLDGYKSGGISPYWDSFVLLRRALIGLIVVEGNNYLILIFLINLLSLIG